MSECSAQVVLMNAFVRDEYTYIHTYIYAYEIDEPVMFEFNERMKSPCLNGYKNEMYSLMNESANEWINDWVNERMTESQRPKQSVPE